MILWILGIIFGSIGLIIGIVVWYRRKILAQLEKDIDKILMALKRAAIKDNNIAESLKHAGIL